MARATKVTKPEEQSKISKTQFAIHVYLESTIYSMSVYVMKASSYTFRSTTRCSILIKLINIYIYMCIQASKRQQNRITASVL